LIYSIPGQDDVTLKKSIEEAIALKPTHVSAYSLTIEEKTVFGKWKKAGKFTPAEEDFAARQFQQMMEMLMSAGFEHYEISNYALPGCYSRHNTSYWQQKKYLGVGPSAHSYNQNSRQFNIANNALYLKAIQQGNIPFELETLTSENKINEYLFTTLRTQWGCSLNYLKENFGFDFRQKFNSTLTKLSDQGLIIIQNNRMTLTQKGKLFADQVASDLFV
jgi:oxygen-independent coproporphyrinogen-3 oxidase